MDVALKYSVFAVSKFGQLELICRNCGVCETLGFSPDLFDATVCLGLHERCSGEYFFYSQWLVFSCTCFVLGRFTVITRTAQLFDCRPLALLGDLWWLGTVLLPLSSLLINLQQTPRVAKNIYFIICA